MISKLKELLGIKPAPNYKELLQEGGIIVDVRSKAEFSGGHIKGSKNIPLQTLSANLEKLKDKNKPIITCCASGMRSASAKSVLKSNGFSNVHNGGSWAALNGKISS
ncbi:rhodanese-like domain-containing protein [Salegentibacter sp. BDJ18]|jgi:rhodanese-related sulfurtransferase|uniref:rhodanese-like domain-containing protein n=1 Tax=Salegentibacter sp. BDJ18 TaxID=2816376 RepID=UPI001AAFC1FA|nr:rhodanese-like domain-containing protein [Salegentibacter sp. BDJ18]MBO2544427.1 rhodanese-like domain-containing protein [Salegentibacter sp. BDJ18]|tara:strand:- start:113 stop:433 length:321 start_codon:yes stop_codon:yes gene_type:complete